MNPRKPIILSIFTLLTCSFTAQAGTAVEDHAAHEVVLQSEITRLESELKTLDQHSSGVATRTALASLSKQEISKNRHELKEQLQQLKYEMLDCLVSQGKMSAAKRFWLKHRTSIIVTTSVAAVLAILTVWYYRTQYSKGNVSSNGQPATNPAAAASGSGPAATPAPTGQVPVANNPVGQLAANSSATGATPPGNPSRGIPVPPVAGATSVLPAAGTALAAGGAAVASAPAPAPASAPVGNPDPATQLSASADTRAAVLRGLRNMARGNVVIPSRSTHGGMHDRVSSPSAGVSASAPVTTSPGSVTTGPVTDAHVNAWGGSTPPPSPSAVSAPATPPSGTYADVASDQSSRASSPASTGSCRSTAEVASDVRRALHSTTPSGHVDTDAVLSALPAGDTSFDGLNTSTIGTTRNPLASDSSSLQAAAAPAPAPGVAAGSPQQSAAATASAATPSTPPSASRVCVTQPATPPVGTASDTYNGRQSGKDLTDESQVIPFVKARLLFMSSHKGVRDGREHYQQLQEVLAGNKTMPLEEAQALPGLQSAFGSSTFTPGTPKWLSPKHRGGSTPGRKGRRGRR